MMEFVGLKDNPVIIKRPTKRELLYFDKLGFLKTNFPCRQFVDRDLFYWLKEQDLVVEYPIEELELSSLTMQGGLDVVALGACEALWRQRRIHAVPLFESPPMFYSYRVDGRRTANAIKVVIDQLPVPDEGVPWQAVLDFRNDPDSRDSLVRLRRWARDMAKAPRPPQEIAQELEYLFTEYEGHMRHQKLKCVAGTLEVVITATAEAIESLVWLQLSKAVKAIASVSKRHLDLVDAEFKAPGREVAYLLKVRDQFTVT